MSSLDLQRATSRHLVRRRRVVFASNGAFFLLLVTTSSALAVVLFLTNDRFLPAIIAGAVMMVGAALTAFVVSHCVHVIQEGRIAEGTVTRRTYLRNSWRIDYSYSIDGEELEDYFGVVAFRVRVKVGEQVTVAVDPTNARSTFLPSLLGGRGPVPCLDTAEGGSAEVVSFTTRPGAARRALGTLVSSMAIGDRIEIDTPGNSEVVREVRRTIAGLECQTSSPGASSAWIAVEYDDLVTSMKAELVPSAQQSQTPITGRYVAGPALLR